MMVLTSFNPCFSDPSSVMDSRDFLKTTGIPIAGASGVSWASNRISSLAATNRPIASKLNFSRSSMRMFTTQHDQPFRLILYWKRVGLALPV